MILVVGSYGTGITLQVPRVPERGETLAGATLSIGYGGKSSNQAVAARRQGVEVELITTVGDDSFGHDAFELWKREGIGSSNVAISKERATMAGAILVEPSGDNRIAIASGALDEMTPVWIEEKADIFDQASLVVLCLECPDDVVTQTVQMAAERKIPVILNPAPAKKLTKETIALATYFIPNETEYEFYKREGYSRTTGQTLIVTRGEEGVLVADETGEREYRPYVQEKVVDTTGAGDTFVGTFAAGIARGLDLDEAVKRAIVSSAISVTRNEVIPAIPRLAEVDEALRIYESSEGGMG